MLGVLVEGAAVLPSQRSLLCAGLACDSALAQALPL